MSLLHLEAWSWMWVTQWQSDSPAALRLNLSEVVRSADSQIALNADTDDHVDARNNTDPGER